MGLRRSAFIDHDGTDVAEPDSPRGSKSPMPIDPHPIRTAIGVIRGALWLEQQGAPAAVSHQLLEHGLNRLQESSEQVLDEYRNLMAELDGRPGFTIWLARKAISVGLKRIRRRAIEEENRSLLRRWLAGDGRKRVAFQQRSEPDDPARWHPKARPSGRPAVD